MSCPGGVSWHKKLAFAVWASRPPALAPVVTICGQHGSRGPQLYCVYGAPRWGHRPRKNSGSHIDASHSRQPLVKGERLVRYEVNAVMSPYALANSDMCCGAGEASCLHNAATSPCRGPLVRATRFVLRKANVDVTPKGALQPAMCNASATREGP